MPPMWERCACVAMMFFRSDGCRPMALISSRMRCAIGVVQGVNQRESIAVIQQESVNMAAESLAHVVNAVG